MFLVLRRNFSGGLALFWSNDLDLHIRTFSPHHIDAVVNPRVDDAWWFTGFYGASKTANREDSWSLLRHLYTQFDLSWVCIGDFNEITRLEEKLRGALRSDKQMQVFRDCLDFYGFKDIGFIGLPFTWCNNRFDGLLVWVRLDRAIASTDWMLKFPFICLHHLAGFSLNHKPIWLCSNDVHSWFYQPLRPFHFEEMWIKDEGCERVVHDAWDLSLEGDPMLNVMHKVKNFQSYLKSWNKNVFGNIRGTVVRKRKLLAKVENVAVLGQHIG